MTFTPLSELDDQLQAVLFHGRERRRSLAGIPELFRTHQFVGSTAMAVASIAAEVFPVRTGDVTFKTAIRVDDNTSTRAGLIFEFGSSTAGVAIWLEDEKIGFRAGGISSNGVAATFDNGGQWPATLELEIVAAVRSGLGLIALWLNGEQQIIAQSAAESFTNSEWSASSAGSFAAAVQGTTPSDVVQTGAPSNFDVIEPLSVYIGSRPRQFPETAVSAFSPLDLSPVWWLDASDSSTITESSGAVSQWDDKSTSGADVAQATSSAQPTTNANTLNGLNVINFDGTADIIAASSSVSLKHLFFVALLELSHPGFVGLFRRFGTDLENLRISGTGFLFLANGNNAENVGDFTFDSGEMRINGVVSELIVADTAFIMSALNPNTASTFIPELSSSINSRFWKGYIAEVVGFDVELSTSDRETLEDYFAAKWGITLA